MSFNFSPRFCYGMAFLAVFVATAAQILLKQSANATVGGGSFWGKFLNRRVALSYALLFASLFLNQIAVIYVPISVLPCITATSFIWVFLFSALILREKPSRRKLLGVAIILAGIAISRL